MTWDSVPWFVGGGAQHSPEVARLLAYAATSGAEGIVTPGDLKVAPLAIPGSSIRVLAGAALILNRAASGNQQTYVGRNPTEDVVAIAPTGSGSGRSDLVVAQIRDPFMPGESWEDPDDPTVGPYIFTTVIPNVSQNTTKPPTGVSGIALARLDIPANTATITSAHIKDLRKLAQPRSERQMFSTTHSGHLQLSDATTYRTWPNVTMQVEVPAWATYADLRVNISGISQIGAFADAWIRAHIGNSVVSTSLYMDNDGWSDGIRHSTVLTASGPLLTAERGTVITLKTSALRYTDAAHPGYYQADPATQIGFDIQFSEKAV